MYRSYAILSFAFFLLSLPLWLASCNASGEVEPFQRQLMLYMNYTNPNGGAPTISFDTIKSDKGVRLNFGQGVTTGVSGPNARVRFDNVRLVDDLGSYQALLESTEEYQLDSWIPGNDQLYVDPNQSLDFVIALDMNKSLSGDLIKIRSFTKNFINQVKEQRPAATLKFAIVAFNDSIRVLNLTNDETAINHFIDSTLATDSNGRRLYDGIDSAYAILNSHSTAQGKTIVTFTNGRNTNNTTLASVQAMLNMPTGNLVKVTHYIIGWALTENSVGITDLKSITSPDGIAIFPADIRSVGRAFNRFSLAASSVYNLVYDRIATTITTPLKIRFIFKAQVF